MKRAELRAAPTDRRVEDIGPPGGWRERRKHVERRIPETFEIEVSADEWAAYFGANGQSVHSSKDEKK